MAGGSRVVGDYVSPQDTVREVLSRYLVENANEDGIVEFHTPALAIEIGYVASQINNSIRWLSFMGAVRILQIGRQGRPFAVQVSVEYLRWCLENEGKSLHKEAWND